MHKFIGLKQTKMVYVLSSVHTGNNVEATLFNAASRTILSTKSNVASILLLVWTGI